MLTYDVVVNMFSPSLLDYRFASFSWKPWRTTSMVGSGVAPPALNVIIATRCRPDSNLNETKRKRTKWKKFH